MRILLFPFKQLIIVFNQLILAVESDLSYNSQVYSLEFLLNDKYDSEDRGISITDAINVDALVVTDYQDSNERLIVGEIADFSEYEIIAYESQDLGENTHKFTINIPDSNFIRDHENELIALVNKYKLAGKGFNLRYY